jgi:hypothetical protein
MPPPLFLQAKVEADQQARALKSHAAWGPSLFAALRRILPGKSRQEISQALYDARGSIEQRSLFIREDRIILLTELRKLEKELLGDSVGTK